MVWLTGGAMAICLVMILALLFFVFWKGFLTFWPEPVIQVSTFNGKTYMGEVTRHDRFKPADEVLKGIPKDKVAENLDEGWADRRLIRTGNFEITNEHFNWVSDFEIQTDGETQPEWAMVFERLAWGRFFGIPKAFMVDGKPETEKPAEIWSKYNQRYPVVAVRGSRGIVTWSDEGSDGGSTGGAGSGGRH